MGNHKSESVKRAIIVEDAAKEINSLQYAGNIDRLHPSLLDSFIKLPNDGTSLNPKQLSAVFGGDLRALRDITKLLFQPDESMQNNNM